MVRCSGVGVDGAYGPTSSSSHMPGMNGWQSVHEDEMVHERERDRERERKVVIAIEKSAENEQGIEITTGIGSMKSSSRERQMEHQRIQQQH
jgi:peroxiredoxin